MRQRFYSILFILFILVAKAFAQQEEFVFKNFTQEEGLPSNESYYVFEDSRHYLWIGTDLGVVRYNGNKFEQFDLPDNVVFKIKEDAKGRIWFFTHKAQLAYFENEKVHVFKYNDRILQRIQKIHITDAYVDGKDNIILNSALDSNYTISADGLITASLHNISTPGSSLYKIDHIKKQVPFVQRVHSSAAGGDTVFVEVNNENKQIKYSIPARHLPITHYGSITTNGHDIYFFAGKMLIKLMEDGSFLLRQMPYKILCLNSSGNNIWVGMIKNGAVLLKPNLIDKIGDTALQDKSITSITTDYEGGRWFSTLEEGVFYSKNTNVLHLQNVAIPNHFVNRLAGVNDTMLLFSTPVGLYSLIEKKVSLLVSLKGTNTGDLFIDGKKSIFYFGGIEHINKIERLHNPYFHFLYTATSPNEVVRLGNDTIVYSRSTEVVIFKSNFLGGTYNNKLGYDSNFLFASKIIFPKPARLFKAKNQIVWGGTNDGLYRINAAHDTMLKFKTSSALLAKGVNCIREMENGMLVTGIRFGGIALIADTTIVANITESEGLLSNKVRYIFPLKNQLWLGTAKGISVIDFTSYQPLKYTVTNIGKNDGFYNVTINQLIQYQEKIVVATSNGIYFIEEPAAFLRKQQAAIPFYISTISSYKGDTSGISSITLPYSKNRLLIKYNAVCFNSAEGVKYQYRFEKSDTSWHTTISPELLMENLQPGVYNLQIKTVIPSQERHSAIQDFTIIVEKPWWQNNWFRLLVVLVVSAAVYLFLKSRIKKIKAEERNKTALNSKMAELEQTALRSQMNPHFIFNCLTSIQQLIVSGNKVDANEYLVKFARLIRKTLELSASPFISIREEMEYLNEYLFLEQLRLSGHFDFSVKTDDAVDKDKIQIPNMMIQPVIENSVRHGIKSLEGRKGLITVIFEQSANFITCTVSDNGIGRTNSQTFNNNAFTEHKSYGVDIVRRRLKTFNEFSLQDIGIEIKDLYDDNGLPAGTQVILQLPFKKIRS